MWYQPDIKSAHVPVAGIILHVRYDNVHIIKSTYCVISNESLYYDNSKIHENNNHTNEKIIEKNEYMCAKD